MTLSKSQLLEAARVTTLPVRQLQATGGCIKIPASQALSLVRSGLYEGSGTLQRVKCIWESDTRTPNVADPDFWDGRGCIRWFPDQRSDSSVLMVR